MELTAELVQQILRLDGFLKSFTLHDISIDQGKVNLEFDLTSNLLRVGDIMNGGAIATILDFAGGLAVMNSNGIVNQVTTNLSIQYMKPVSNGPIKVSSWITKDGKHLTFVEMELKDHAGSLCAKAHGSWYVFRNE